MGILQQLTIKNEFTITDNLNYFITCSRKNALNQKNYCAAMLYDKPGKASLNSAHYKFSFAAAFDILFNIPATELPMRESMHKLIYFN